MTAREKLATDVARLSDADLQRVERFIHALRSRPPMNETALRALYSEAGDEDRLLAQEGMAEYSKGLKREDER